MLLILLDFQSILETCFGSDRDNLTPWQMMLRAVVTFLIALVLIRLAGIRSFGKKSAFDIVVSITFGAVLSRCITGHYSYVGCVSAVTVLALMHRLIAMIAMHYSAMEKIIKGNADVILKNDKINWKNMKRHNLTKGDLTETLHKNGFLSTDEIEEAFFETDGKITIVPKHKALITQASKADK